jgi:hypothetical protein
MGSIRLGMVYPQEPAPFYAPMTAGINAAVADLSDFGVEVEHIRFSMQKQDLEEETLEKLNPAGFQGLAINSAGPRIARQISRLSEAGIPVVTFNTDAVNSTRRFFIGNDSIQSGRMGAALLGRFLGGEGAVTVLGNFVQAMPFSERFGALRDHPRRFPNMTLYPAPSATPCASWPPKLITLLKTCPRCAACSAQATPSRSRVSALKQLDRKDIVLIATIPARALARTGRAGATPFCTRIPTARATPPCRRWRSTCWTVRFPIPVKSTFLPTSSSGRTRTATAENGRTEYARGSAQRRSLCVTVPVALRQFW